MFIKRRAPAERSEHKDFLRAFEIPPVNLDLLRSDERDAAIAATRELYDAIPGPFQILSVPIERSPSSSPIASGGSTVAAEEADRLLRGHRAKSLARSG